MSQSLSNDQFLLKNTILPHELQRQKGALDKSSFFEFFAATQWLRKCDFSEDEILTGVVGDGNDGGCDCVYITYNGMLVQEDNVDSISLTRNAEIEMYILQAKESFSFGEDAIMRLKTVSDNLLKLEVKEDDYQSRYNEGVRSIFARFRDFYQKAVVKQVRLKFHYAYASLAKDLHPNVQAQADELKVLVCKNFPAAEVDFRFIGATDLLLLYQTDNNLKLILPLAAPPIALGGKNEYVALVKLVDFFAFITDSENNGSLRKVLFESNVRDYQGSSINVNRKIQETLLTNFKDDFWWLNNGITVLAQTVEQIGGTKLQIESPEIVNGLQTTSEIYSFYRKYQSKLKEDKRSLLVRIIVPETEETRDNIICATNSQTLVNPASLRVTDPIHRKIETYCKGKGLYYDRRKNQYKNEGRSASEIVSVLFLGQCMVSILLQLPDYARARPSQILSENEKYTKLYNDKVPLDVFYKCARIGKLVNAYLWQRNDISAADRRNVLFHTIYATASCLAKTATPSVVDITRLSETSVTNDLIKNTSDAILDMFRKEGGRDQVAKGPEFTKKIAAWVAKQFATNSTSAVFSQM